MLLRLYSRLSPFSSPFSTLSSSLPPRNTFDPSKILPFGQGEVRVISNTSRDAQQSNCSAEMSHGHRMAITKMVDDCYKGTEGAPGYEQIWGGTIPMFDLWKRGVQPFDSLRQQVAYMPNTPTSMLFRSTAINSMSNLPYDVIDAFVKRAMECGMNVYTNFDAHNDWRNHVKVAESVLKYGGHYQAALSWAVYNADPTIYNVQWAVDFFRNCVKLGAHSLYVKDPSGVLTPDMAAALSRQVKEAFPTLPLVFHTHYQTGYGYMTYLKAVENGANGVECSVGFSDGAGQPYSLTMLRAFEEAGFNTGKPNKKAMRKLSEYCRQIRVKYPTANTMRSPDISVEDSGIAGGQRSILDKELRDVGQAALIPQVDIMVAAVRAEGGKVCQVTPVADTYAREAMRRLRGGDPTKNFVPGYAGILCGDGGLVKEPVLRAPQLQALIERVTAQANSLKNENKVPAIVATDAKFLASLVSLMEVLSSSTLAVQRLDELQSRLSQLEVISKKPELLAQMNRKFELACTYADAPAKTLSARVKQLEAEVQDIKKSLGSKSVAQIAVETKKYESLLACSSSEKDLTDVIASNAQLNALVNAGTITKQVAALLLSKAGVVTCVSATLLPPTMEKSRAAIVAMEQEETLGMCETDTIKEDLSVLHACFEKAAIPGLYANFLRNYRENPAYFPKLFTGHVRSSSLKAPVDKPTGLRLNLHKWAEEKIEKSLMDEIITVRKQIIGLADRLYTQSELSKKRFPLEESDPAAFKRRLGASTLARINSLKAEKEAKLKELKLKASQQCGKDIAFVDELIKFAL